jgi:hypothetical protein
MLTFWCAAAIGTLNAWSLYLDRTSDAMDIHFGTSELGGYSIRCLKY